MLRMWPQDLLLEWPQSLDEDSSDEATSERRAELTVPEYEPGFSCLTLYLVGEELGDDGFTSAAAAGGTVVRSKVCPALSEEVVEAVLLRLPAAAQARCRAVCKAWLALLASAEFSRRSFLHSLSQTTHPLCAYRYWPEEEYYFKPYDSQEELLPIPPVYKSLKVDLSFVPEVFHSWESLLHNCSPTGFMCISTRVHEGMHVCVLNPVNQSFQVLPILENVWSHHVVLLTGTVTATERIPSFKVYVPPLGPLPKFLLPVADRLFKGVAMYSSISGEWKGFLASPEVEMSDPPPVVCNGDLYSTVNSTPPRLVRLSTETGAGHLRDLALPHFENRRGQRWKSEFLAGHGGRLLYCDGGIGMLDDDRQLWVEIAGRCPPDILPPGNSQTQPLRLKCVHVAGDLVVFFYELWFRGPRTGKVDCPVAYDMLRRSWRKVPQSMARVGEVFQPMPNLRL